MSLYSWVLPRPRAKVLAEARFGLRVNLSFWTPCSFPCHRLLNQYSGLIAQVRIEMRDGIAWAIYFLSLVHKSAS